MAKKKTAKKKAKKVRRTMALRTTGIYSARTIVMKPLTVCPKKQATKKRAKPKPLKRWIMWDARDHMWRIYLQAAQPDALTQSDYRVPTSRDAFFPERYRKKAKRTGKVVEMTTLSE
jgi:hypothetical protein